MELGLENREGELKFHPNLLETRQEQGSIQRLCEHIAFVVAGRAISDSAIKLWLSIDFARQDVLFHFWEEGFVKGANTGALHAG